MSACSNCKGRISCGCQRRTASDGVQCCSNCIKAYEQGLIAKQIRPNGPAPSLKNVWGKSKFINK